MNLSLPHDIGARVLSSVEPPDHPNAEPKVGSGPHRANQTSRSILPQMHRWSDAFGPLVLARCLPPAFSLTILLLACVAYWATGWLHNTIDVWLPAQSTDRFLTDSTPLQYLPTNDAFGRAVRYSLTPTFVSASALDQQSIFNGVAKQAVMLLIWLVPIGLVLRGSITSCAERRSAGLIDNLRLLLSRAVALLSTALIPLVAVWFVASVFLVTGLITRFSPIAGDLAMLMAVPFLLATGILGFGALFAVPLAWASVLTEKDCDTFDALSRGYEYTFRRPLHLVVYLIAAWAIHSVAYHLVRLVCLAGWNIAARLAEKTQGTESLPGVTEAFMRQFPEVFAIVMFWSLVGGVYLLLRRDANHQEVEDIVEKLLPVQAESTMHSPRLATSDDSTSSQE